MYINLFCPATCKWIYWPIWQVLAQDAVHVANKLGLCTSARTQLWDDEQVQLLISMTISARFPELSSYNHDCSEEFLALEFQKTFILRLWYLILLRIMGENVNFSYLYLTTWDAPSCTLVSNTLLPIKGCLEIISWETTFSSTFSADLASSSLQDFSHTK